MVMSSTHTVRIGALVFIVSLLAAVGLSPHARAADMSHNVATEEQFRDALAQCGANVEFGETCTITVTGDIVLTGTHGSPEYNGDGHLVIHSAGGHTISQESRASDIRFLTFHSMYSDTTLTIDGLTLSGFGSAAVSSGGTIYTNANPIVIRRSSIMEGYANDFGGAVYSNGGPVTIEDSELVNNYAGLDGGAVYVLSGDNSATIDRSAFVANTAGRRGGALYAHQGLALTTLSTFVDNAAEGAGGAMSTETGFLKVLNSSFALNYAVDGVHLDAGTGGYIFVYGSVFDDGGADGGACYSNGGLIESHGYNGFSGADCAGAVDATDLVNLGSTFFRGPQHYGGPTRTLLPHPDSPIIDAIPVVECTPEPDQRGVSRPQGAGCEIGALEVGPATFTDVPMTHAFAPHILWLELSGITGGYDDGTFRPSATVSRQAMAAFLYRMVGEPAFTPPATASFPDVGLSHPFYAEIEWLVSEGVTTGYGDGTFRPGAHVSRQAAAAFMHRLIQGGTSTPASQEFTDVPPSHDFYAAIGWIAAIGVTTGYSDGTFRGSGAVTRQAMAAFIARILNIFPFGA